MVMPLLAAPFVRLELLGALNVNGMLFESIYFANGKLGEIL